MARAEIIGLLAIFFLFILTVPFFVSSGGSSGGTVVDANLGFVDLNDTPSSYVGQANKFVSVKATEDGLEFTTASASGDTNCSNNALCILTGRINAPTQDENINDINANGIIDVNTLRVTPTSSVSNSTSVGGAIRLTNTNNNGAGLIIYSNNGASQNGRLVNVRSDNNANTQAGVHIDYNGTANALEVVHTGQDATAQAFNVVSNNMLDSAFTVTSNVTSRAVSKIVHSGYPGDSSSSGQTVDLQGDGTQAQGLYVDSTATSGTRGDLLRLRNRSIDQFWVDANGNANSISDINGFRLCIQDDCRTVWPTVSSTGSCDNNSDCNITGRINTNYDANFNSDVNIQGTLTLDGNVIADQNINIGESSATTRNRITFYGQQYNSYVQSGGYALGISSDTYAFCVHGTNPCSGLYFRNAGRRGFDFTITGQPIAHFGVANGVGSFWLPARTTDPTSGSQDKNSGTMYVKSTDINRLVMNIGTYATPNFTQVGSNLSEDVNFQRSLALGLDLNLVRDVNVGRQILMRTTAIDVNACAGQSTLASGKVTVVTSCAKTNSLIFVTPVSKASGTNGALYVSPRNDNNFTISSTQGADDSNVVWMIIKPA